MVDGNYVLIRESEEHKTSWMELLLDVSFVVLVASIAHPLVHADWETVGVYALLFYSVFKVWGDHCVYVNRYDSQDLIHRLLFVIMMILTAALGSSAHGMYHGETSRYISTFIMTRVFFFLLNFYGFYSTTEDFGRSFAACGPFLFSTALYVITYFIDTFWIQCILWVGAMFGELGVSSGVARVVDIPRSAVAIEHLVERYGLFTIIILGEIVVASVGSLDTEETASGDPFYVSIWGIVLAFGLMFQYFEVDTLGIYGEHALRWKASAGFSWILGHIPLLMVMAAVGPAVSAVLEAVIPDEEGHTHELETAGLALLHGSVSLSILLLWFVRTRHRFSYTKDQGAVKATGNWMTRGTAFFRVLGALVVFGLGFLEMSPVARIGWVATISMFLGLEEIIVGHEYLRLMLMFQASERGDDPTAFYRRRWKRKIEKGTAGPWLRGVVKRYGDGSAPNSPEPSVAPAHEGGDDTTSPRVPPAPSPRSGVVQFKDETGSPDPTPAPAPDLGGTKEE